jgi:hypothetical protein
LIVGQHVLVFCWPCAWQNRAIRGTTLVDTNCMHTLTRQQIIERLRAAGNTPASLRTLPAWAFEQFYAAEEGSIAWEPGYRRVISTVLDDLMFADDAAFALVEDDVARLINTLEHAQPTPDNDDDDDDEE